MFKVLALKRQRSFFVQKSIYHSIYYSIYYFFIILGIFLLPNLTFAHGFGQRIDLPIPLKFYLIGAGATVLVSFALLSFIRHKGKHLDDYKRFNLLGVSWIKETLDNKLFRFVVKGVFVFYLLLVIIAGLTGSQVAVENIASTSVWILFGVGMTYVSAFIGNIWAFINPWKTIFDWIKKTFKIRTIKERWPRKLAYWPALIIFFVYRWIENVYPNSAEPQFISIVLVFYTLITFAGMRYFGVKNWLRYGDGFSVFFRLLSKFSITEYRKVGDKKELNLRPPAVGLFKEGKTSWTEMLFVMLMLSTLAFDGLEATPLWKDTSIFLLTIFPSSFVVGTIGLLVLLLFFYLTYKFFSYLIGVSARSEDRQTISFRFLYSLLPIAIAYELAHFISLLLIEGQRIIYLLSDPFGKGWNLIGTAEYSINFSIIDLKFLWNAQVALIVLGHIVSVYVAHIVAVHLFKERRKAVKSQYPMLFLMVLYTIFSLWIISQPIVVGG